MTLRPQLGAGAADLAQLLPELRDLFPDLPEPPALEPEGARFRLFEAVSSLPRDVRRESGRSSSSSTTCTPPTSRRCSCSAFLARELGGRRVLIVGAYRDVDPTLRDPLDGGFCRARARAGDELESTLAGLA